MPSAPRSTRPDTTSRTGDPVNVPAKLAGFAVVLLATFGAAFGVGRAVGPIGDETDPAPMDMGTTTTAPGHDGGHP